MGKLLFLSVLVFISFCAAGSAQSIDTSGTWKMLPDTSRTIAPTADSTSAQAKTDTLHTASAGTMSDTASNLAVGSNLKLIKRNYNSRQQILLASGMMIFVIAMMTLAQQFNPN